MSDQSTVPDLPVLVIVGRPNVGKSSLFNRIVGRRQAIVHEESGVTRDRVIARARWGDRAFTVVDTGGLPCYRGETPNTALDGVVREQLLQAIDAADAIVFMVEADPGIHALDQEIAALLRPTGKPVTVAVNKADNPALGDRAGEFFALGFDSVLPVSVLHNTNVGELVDRATDAFPNVAEALDRSQVRIAVVGRPNVGKSSTVNRLLGADRVIVSDVPGTTRDAIDIPLTVTLPAGPRAALLIDTAGLRRRRRVDSAVEFFSVSRARTAIKRADVVLVLIDATSPGTAMDKRICRLVAAAGKTAILLANKWDLASGQVKQKELFAALRRALPFMGHCEMLTCCAASGYNFSHILPLALALHDRMPGSLPTPLVNRVVADSVARHPPPPSSAGILKIYYGIYRGPHPATFLLFVNRKEACRANYLAYLVQQFRRAFDLDGLPVNVELRQRSRAPGWNRKRPARAQSGSRRRG